MFGLFYRDTSSLNPFKYSSNTFQGANFVLYTNARLDNREELLSACKLNSFATKLTDREILFHAYKRWGEESSKYILGDWSFAAWHPKEKKLFLARDCYGHSSIYYLLNRHVCAFSTTLQPLLNLKLTPIELDELYLAEVLATCTCYHDERTIHKPILRLPPAHTLTVTPTHAKTNLYWKMEEVSETKLAKKEDYVVRFRELFDQAVKVRLRTGEEPANGSSNGTKIASSLSCGLDSGSVSATAAKLLKEEGKRLTTYTHVPLHETDQYVNPTRRIGNEWPLAQKTARHWNNIDPTPIRTENISPLQAIRMGVSILNSPQHAAGNFFWMFDMYQLAHLSGHKILLTGQKGNGGFSWAGDIFSQPTSFQIAKLGWMGWSKEKIKSILPVPFLRNWYERNQRKGEWWKNSAIHPAFAKSIHLLDHLLTCPHSLCLSWLRRTPLEHRFQILKPAQCLTGTISTELEHFFNIKSYDPTADTRLLEFTLSIPDSVFMDPKTKIDRWLAREAMKDRLPEEVRLNRLRGLQSADIVPRLRACAGEVEGALMEVEKGPGSQYVNLPFLREKWVEIQHKDTPQQYRDAVVLLTRGLFAGLWVNKFNGN